MVRFPLFVGHLVVVRGLAGHPRVPLPRAHSTPVMGYGMETGRWGRSDVFRGRVHRPGPALGRREVFPVRAGAVEVGPSRSPWETLPGVSGRVGPGGRSDIFRGLGPGVGESTPN